MPTPTPELGLEKALDADDTADYLDTSLANSLTTLDSLFSNVSGHTHGGVHQGGPISSIPISAIPDGSITSAKITDGSIQTVDLAPGAVTTTQIADGAVNSAKIADGSITGADIAPGTIQGSNLANGAVGNAQLAAGSVLTANIADGQINSAKIADGSIVGADIAAETVTSNNIANGTITSADIGAGQVTGSNIANGAVSAAQLATNDNFTMFGLHVTNNTTLDGTVSIPSGAVIANGTGGQVSIGTTPYSAYRLTLANLGSPAGQGIAQGWLTYACVDHAREAGLQVAPVEDATSKLRALDAYYYDHMSLDEGNQPVMRDGTPVSTPTYGMSPTEVAAVIPELAGDNSVDYGRLLSVLWTACQEMDARLTAAGL